VDGHKKAMEPVFDILQLMSQEEPPGFTPVRRRDQPQYNASPALSTSAPWTTSRCNRLLRPLSSRITLLRRHREQKDSKSKYAQAVASGIDLKTRGKTEDIPCDAPQLFPPPPSRQDDPEWRPDYEPRKRLKRTYSSKSGSQKGTQPEVGGQAIPLRRTQFRIQVPVVDPHASQSCSFLAPGRSSLVGAQSWRGVPVPEQDNISREVTRPKALPKPALTREYFRRLAKSISPDEWMLDSGIYSGLDALLKATAKHTPRTVTGARSLFASCLRKVPEYIAEEQRWVDEEDEDDDTDISSTIYAELESLGSGESGGWKPLREIVRAHGVTIIKDAIRDGTIRPGTARALTVLCLQTSAHDEADSLLDSSLSTLQRLAKPVRLTDNLFETSICLRTLRDTTSPYRRWRFLHRSLNRLLLNGIVPVEWMSCQCMVDCWNHATGDITRQDKFATEAVDLVRTVISLSYQTADTLGGNGVHMHRLSSPAGRIPLRKPAYCDSIGDGCVVNFTELKTHEETKMSPEFTGTVSRLLAILLSINTMYLEDGGAVAPARHNFLQELLLTQAVDAHHLETTTPSSAHSTRICLPLLAYVLMSAELTEDSVYEQLCATFFSRIGRLESGTTETGTLASFLCAITHCCEKNGGKTGFEYMQSIIQRLLHLSQHPACTRPALRSLNSLITEAAFDFAEQTTRQEHLDWALEVEEMVDLEFASATGQQQTMTPGRATQKKGAGFRWEDGICEWIAKTPAPFAVVIPRPRESLSESSGSSDGDDRTDFSTWPSEVDDSPVLSQPLRRPRGRPPGTKRASDGDDTSTLPSEIDDSSVFSHPRRPRGRPPGSKRARSSVSCVDEPAVKPATRSTQLVGRTTREAADEVFVHKPSRGRLPRRRVCLADVTNFPVHIKERIEGDGSFQKKRLGECAARPAARRTGGRKRKSAVLGEGDFSEDELGM